MFIQCPPEPNSQSNFLAGWLAGWLHCCKPAPIRAQFFYESGQQCPSCLLYERVRVPVRVPVRGLYEYGYGLDPSWTTDGVIVILPSHHHLPAYHGIYYCETHRVLVTLGRVKRGCGGFCLLRSHSALCLAIGLGLWKFQLFSS